jgi:hypothetical protein
MNHAIHHTWESEIGDMKIEVSTSRVEKGKIYVSIIRHTSTLRPEFIHLLNTPDELELIASEIIKMAKAAREKL